jgi:hypothetical protein
MALKKDTTTPHGFVAPAAYHRVEGVMLTSKTEMAFRVRTYKEVGLPHFSDLPVVCAYSLDGANPIAQAYAHLKTLPEFAGAVDC